MTGRHRGVAFGAVPFMGSRQLVGIDLHLGAAYASPGFEAVHITPGRCADEPETGRHRPAVVEQGSVAEHHRIAAFIAHDHLVGAAGGAAQ